MMKINVLRFPGLAERIRKGLEARGYWKEGRPDVLRFARDYEVNDEYIYRWLRGTTPNFDHLQTLAKALDVPIAWLLLGDHDGRGRHRPLLPQSPKPLRRRGRSERLCQPELFLQAIRSWLWPAPGMVGVSRWGFA